MNDKEKLINLLKQIRLNKIYQDVSLININYDFNLIKEGILFDNENSCYYNYKTLDEMITSLSIASQTYGIYYDDEFIGMISYFHHYYKDPSRYEISISIKEEYRNSSIGYCVASEVIRRMFLFDDIKSIHLYIREDNTRSNALALKLGFKEYPGYKCDNYFTDKDNNKIKNKQYLLKKKLIKQ